MGKKRGKMKPKERLFLEMSQGRRLNLQCIIEKSQQSDGHGVYLELDRGKNKQHRLISVHAKILDAWEVCKNGMSILENSNFSYSQTNDEITQEFIHKLVETYGDYNSDDAQYQPKGDNRIILPWLLSGGKPDDPNIPEGITIEVINPPVTKKWKIYHRKCSHPDYSQGMYAIGTSDTDVLLIEETERVVISNAYILAAYVADHLNDTDHSERYLAQTELDRLYAEAETVFCVDIQNVDLNDEKKFKNNISRFANANWMGLFTTDGTPITRAAVWECDNALICGDYIRFDKGALAGKIYYPTSVEGTEFYFKMPYHAWEGVAKHNGVAMPLFPKIENGVAIDFWDWVRDNNIVPKKVDCPFETGRFLTQGIVAVFVYPHTNRPRMDCN
ncbi:hypothetical protein [Microcoleus sp. MOSTC5]|uniref:hypothetical protein n=1 Tax=Microcoleus sp. MOSTC5 TaxID=3055378 RepID=UPI002FD3E886